MNVLKRPKFSIYIAKEDEDVDWLQQGRIPR